jgi:hypothetical protein
MKRAEADFDAASDRFTEAEQALDAAREQRARARENGTRPGRHTSAPRPLRPGSSGRVTALSAHLDEIRDQGAGEPVVPPTARLAASRSGV